MAFAASVTVLSLREQIDVFAPSCAKSSVMASPIPRPPPEIIATLPRRPQSIPVLWIPKRIPDRNAEKLRHLCRMYGHKQPLSMDTRCNLSNKKLECLRNAVKVDVLHGWPGEDRDVPVATDARIARFDCSARGALNCHQRCLVVNSAVSVNLNDVVGE